MTTLQDLIEARLGENLTRWLIKARLQGMSYRTIAEVLEQETDVTVSKSTLHLWLQG